MSGNPVSGGSVSSPESGGSVSSPELNSTGPLRGNLLDGRTVLVTGAAGGVGAGIVLACAAQGANVVITARVADDAAPVAETVVAEGGRSMVVECDVTRRADVDRAVEAAVERFGGLDVMVHNAIGTVGPPRDVGEVPEETWRTMMDTAVGASFSCAQAAYPHLAARRGSLVFLVSTAGVEGNRWLPAYGVVKGAQRGLAKSLAREWGPAGVRVNCLAPLALTPAMERTYRENPVLEERLLARTPLRRVGDPTRDIGSAAVFLASELSCYVTGQTLVATGGGYMA